MMFHENRLLTDDSHEISCLFENQDSEINHIRYFIKVQFVNKGTEFINLPSIFKDTSLLFLLILKIRNHLLFVISTINIFVAIVINYYKLVTELDIETANLDS